jgi:hypothetical protein
MFAMVVYIYTTIADMRPTLQSGRLVSFGKSNLAGVK